MRQQIVSRTGTREAGHLTLWRFRQESQHCQVPLPTLIAVTHHLVAQAVEASLAEAEAEAEAAAGRTVSLALGADVSQDKVLDILCYLV